MERIATWPTADRAELIREASALKGMPVEVMEKDFWVCWVLHRLFHSPDMARKILFKGGTSLSKVFGLIQRFSEDVDIILDWREVTDEDPADVRSVGKQDKFNCDQGGADLLGEDHHPSPRSPPPREQYTAHRLLPPLLRCLPHGSDAGEERRVHRAGPAGVRGGIQR